MPVIDIDQHTFELLDFSSRLLGKPIGEVVRDLVSQAGGAGATAAPPPKPVDPSGPERAKAAVGAAVEWLVVFKEFKGHRIEGEFNPNTMQVRVLTAPWSGKVFSSPTAAAQDVVLKFAGDRETPNTNGRKFWRLAGSGRDLRSVVGQRH